MKQKQDWKEVFDGMFSECADAPQPIVMDCTKDTLQEALSTMPHRPHQLKDIIWHARGQGIDANETNVLAALRELFKGNWIIHRQVADRHFFTYRPPAHLG